MRPPVQKVATFSLTEETLDLLEEIARREATPERPNVSLTLRQMIREKAERLGIVISPNGKKERAKAA